MSLRKHRPKTCNLLTMISTIYNNVRYHLGLSLAHEDGNAAAMVAPTTKCPEASCINFVKPLDSGQLVPQSPLTDRERYVNTEIDIETNTRNSDTETNTRNSDMETNIRNNDTETLNEMNIDTNDNEETDSDEDKDKDRELRNATKMKMKKLGQKYGTRIASLNVHGKENSKGESKYKDLATMIRKNKLTILGIQETRLNEEETARLQQQHPKIIIENNGNSTAKEGVAFILNKDLVNGRRWIHTKIIQNRVSRLQIQITENEGLDIILIYAPNETIQKINFYEKLRNELNKIKDWQEPILMGGFNFVEDDIDRYPMRLDDMRLNEEFNKLKKKYKWVDGWRIQNPKRTDYTFYQSSSESKSRIDRIYVTETMCTNTYNWDILTTGNISDHDMTIVEILKKNLPYVGDGLWRISEGMFEYEPFRKQVKKVLRNVQTKIEQHRKAEQRIIEKYKDDEQKRKKYRENLRKRNTPQRMWQKAKEHIKEIAKEEHEK